MTTVTISLPEPLRDFIEEQVKVKGYGDISEYMRDLVQEAQEAESSKRLESLLLEGLESGGDDIEVNETFWKDLKAETTAQIAEHKRQQQR
jgi:antitoxin ParD1/3/4